MGRRGAISEIPMVLASVEAGRGQVPSTQSTLKLTSSADSLQLVRQTRAMGRRGVISEILMVVPRVKVGKKQGVLARTNKLSTLKKSTSPADALGTMKQTRATGRRG